MMDALIEKLAKNFHIYQSRWLTIFLGVSKMICATVLMLLYGWSVEWDRKFNICLMFVIFSCLVYGIEYGLDVVWWPHWRGTFWQENSEMKLIVCAHSPFYSGDFAISFYFKTSGTFFQRLGQPVLAKKFSFTDFFTEGGYFLQGKWEDKCDVLIKKVLAHKQKVE
jgi:hypothetical protein